MSRTLKPFLYLNCAMADAEAVLLDLPAGQVAVFSGKHPTRDGNEDAAVVASVGTNDLVLAVADGMGGAASGARASEAAARAVAGIPQAIRDGTGDREAVLAAFERANQTVIDFGIGAATTLALASIGGGQMRSYHTGDSLVLVTGGRGKVKLQTVSHSPVGYALEAGLLDEDEAMEHDERHLVSNMVGGADMRMELSSAVQLSERDTVLIASDGLSDNLYIDEIVELIRKRSLEEAAHSLARECTARMMGEREDTPSKPDDLTFILFRPRKGAAQRSRARAT